MEGLSKLGIEPLSVLVYLINTGLLLVVLTYVLYKPVMKFIDARRKQISDSVDEARLLKDELDKKGAEVAATQAHFEVELKKEREALRKFAEEKRSEFEAEMTTARAKMLQKAQEEIETRKGELMKEVESSLLLLIKKIVLEVVQHKVPEDVIQASIHDAWKSHKN